jgi:DmsE family decaheme c-type cytochrome
MNLNQAFKRGAAALVLALGPGLALATVPANAPNAGAAYSPKGADSCLTCHEGPEVNDVFHTAHAQVNDPRAPFGQGGLQCEACHGPGGSHVKKPKKGEERTPMIKFGRNVDTPVDVQNAMCLGCHEKAQAAGWHIGPHEANKVSCAACHDSHQKRDAVLARTTQPDVCFSCHVAERGQFMKPYSHPLRQGELGCSDCHDPHGTTAEKQLVRSTINDTCYECHAEKRGPLLWEHEPVAENCDACHSPHGATNPGMVKLRAPLLCQSCHSQQGHPSFAYGPQSLPGGSSPATAVPLGSCMNCHSQVHGSNHPSGSSLTR